MNATEQALVDRVTRRLNQAMSNVSDYLGIREPRWRCYGPRGALRGKPATVYCWSVERINGKYRSWVYHYYKTKKQWHITQERNHAKRQDAKARALELYQEATA